MAFVVHSPEVSSLSGCRRVESTSNSHNLNTRYPKTVSTFKYKLGARVRVCLSIKDAEIKDSEFDQKVRLYGQLSAHVKPGLSPSSLSSSLKQTKEGEEKQNYYVNTGYAIRALREEFPELFYRELNFNIYRDDIVFKDPLNTFIGIQNYKSIFWALRFHGRIFFKALWVDIISVWQPMENVIMVRWTVHGIPRVPWESRGRFDATSEYKLDKNGKIFEHRVDNIVPNTPNAPQKFRVMTVSELIQSLGCPSTPKPTYFKVSSSSIMKLVPLDKLTLVRM